ncbi:hypothetical protein BGX20_000473, partial [Mortierella sp. AD010]
GTYYLPNDLKNSGFYQLASLKELRAISVCFFQDEDSLSGCKSQVFKDARTTVSNEDEVVGFLHRKDLKWMVEQWPSIKLLEFRGSFHSDDELKKAQHWVNEATGRSDVVVVIDVFAAIASGAGATVSVAVIAAIAAAATSSTIFLENVVVALQFRCYLHASQLFQIVGALGVGHLPL